MYTQTRKPLLVKILILIVLAGLVILPACSMIPALPTDRPQDTPTPAPSAQEPSAIPVAEAPAGGQGLLAAFEGTLSNLFTQVSPSVVFVSVARQTTDIELPFDFPQRDLPRVQRGFGSGFVWDEEGHIVTNNHVVDGAQRIEVTFSDGTVATASVVGSDPDSDLAVLKVDVTADLLHPVTLADSTLVRVGDLAIAIGNPFGLQNTMTVGIISALGRSLPAGTASNGGTYSIPNIIQTDAPINPGNSGGVLVDDTGKVIGVTAAIESTTNANAGIGFVIPSEIVGMVVPVLIQDGQFDHAWLGISGISLNPILAKAAGLEENQRGVLVNEVATNSPADNGGLIGSSGVVEVEGMQLPAGGDVITSINGQVVQKMEDLIAYLATDTTVGQQVTLGILREGNEQTLSVTLAARPTR